MADRERYVFRLTAWNELAGVDDTFTLFYFIKNDGRVDVEILEPAKKRKFLSRVHYPSLKLEDIRPGGKVIIYGRMYSVVDYEDGPTRAALGRTQETSFGLITQAGMGAAGRIWQAGEASGLRVVAARLVNLSEEDAASVSSGLEGRVSAGPVLAISFIGESSQSKLASLAAHIHEQAGVPPRSLLPASHDAQHGRLAAAFFGPASARLASAGDAAGSFEHCACVLILPTAVKDGVSGAIFAELQAALAASRGALSVSALRTVDLSRPQAEEFLEVYKGVVPEYQVRAVLAACLT